MHAYPSTQCVAERKNKHATEVAHALMNEKNVPNYDWAEAVDLKVFGCITYFHIPYEKRTKLDPK